jgi:hypothetical protein
MVRYFSALIEFVYSWATHMSQRDWMCAAVLAVCIGFVALRGYGSRTAY